MIIYILRPYVGFESEGGGLDRYLTLCKFLQKAGAKPTLFCGTFHHNKKTIRNNEMLSDIKSELSFVQFINCGRYKKNISFERLLYEFKFGLISLLSIMKSEKPDSILIGEPLFFVGFILSIYCLFKKIKIYGDFIDIFPESYIPKTPLNLFLAKFLKFFTFTRWVRANLIYSKTFYVSEYYKNKILCESINKKNHQVFYWCAEKVLSKKVSIKSKFNQLILVYAGSLGEGYDIELIIEAAKLLNIQAPNTFRFIIAGSGPKERLCEDASSKGIIEFLGHLNKKELCNLYSISHIGLLPYKINSAVSMPIKLFDYINFNLVILSSLKMEARGIIKKYNIGISYNAQDLKSFIASLENIQLILRSKSNNFVLATEKFDIDFQYKSFSDALISNCTHGQLDTKRKIFNRRKFEY
jgi:hypothetical protein